MQPEETSILLQKSSINNTGKQNSLKLSKTVTDKSFGICVYVGFLFLLF